MPPSRRTPLITAFACASAIALALSPVGAQPAKAPAASASALVTAAQIVERVQAFYDKTRTFTARFDQKYRLTHPTNKVKKDGGQVYFQKPGKMSWRYRYPDNGNRIVSDGKTLWVYEADSKQVILQKLSASYYPAALAFLIGGARLDQTLDLSLDTAETRRFSGGYALHGKPKTPSPLYTDVYFYVDAKTYQVRRIVLIDAQANQNSFEFAGPKVNVPMPAGEFSFKVPQGATLVRP